MTTTGKIDLDCPCCGCSFSSHSITSTNTFGPLTTDLRRLAAGAQPLAYCICSCPSCGYSGYAGEFRDDAVTETVRERTRAELTPLGADDPLFAARRYEYAARIAEWRRAPGTEVGDRYLRAAWCCVDSEDGTEEEMRYRREAISHFEAALRAHEIPGHEVVVYTYLIGELYRRVGDAAEASNWFDRVAGVVPSEPECQWLVQLAQRQKTDPREFFEPDELDGES